MVRFDCKGFLADPSGYTGQLDAAADHFIREGYGSFLQDTKAGPSLEVGGGAT